MAVIKVSMAARKNVNVFRKKRIDKTSKECYNNYRKRKGKTGRVQIGACNIEIGACLASVRYYQVGKRRNNYVK